MNGHDFNKLGLPAEARSLVIAAVAAMNKDNLTKATIRKAMRQVANSPADYLEDIYLGSLAAMLAPPPDDPSMTDAQKARRDERMLLEAVPYRQWGEDLEDSALDQMRNACRLPVSVAGALMPDAHPGYGLPIGGVLATDNAVIPYAVGVDIACRMKLTILDLPASMLDRHLQPLQKAIEDETRFGIGASFKRKRDHAVMDADWEISPVTRRFKDRAWGQLGTSGSGNHFVEFGTMTLDAPDLGLEAGVYLALLSHSGSRGTGANVCAHYSRLARELHTRLPSNLTHLAWLDLDSEPGAEYWAAMQLMGEYAAANHALIHKHIVKHVGGKVLVDIENHHNFAWKEVHDGREVVVHRKGATPAGAGVLGIIPGSMATPGYVVRGKGSAASLLSCSHGAGRIMSRTKAKETFRWPQVKPLLAAAQVTLLSADIDECPGVYKDIETVMAAQQDLVDVIGRFDPRIVKMAPTGERAED